MHIDILLPDNEINALGIYKIKNIVVKQGNWVRIFVRDLPEVIENFTRYGSSGNHFYRTKKFPQLSTYLEGLMLAVEKGKTHA